MIDHDDQQMIEELQQRIRQTEERLRRWKDALAALKGKSLSRRGNESRGFRSGSIPALAHEALSTAKSMTLDELTSQLKKTKAALDSRKVSIALSKYVRKGQNFAVGEDGRYSLK